jgi:periplasmic protein TonB
MDSPWHRLPWTLPTALLIWAVALWGLAYFMGKPTHRPMEPSAIDAQLIEQAVSPPTAAVHQTKPLPPVMPLPSPVISRVSPTTEQNPATQKAEVTTSAGAVSTAAPNGKSSSRGSIFASSGARAIIKPMPQIPDDLREEAFNSVALALFHIAVDGSVTVELAKSTPNPRLNRILLDSLRKWRFIPAIMNGKPVASTEEIVIKIEVK